MPSFCHNPLVHSGLRGVRICVQKRAVLAFGTACFALCHRPFCGGKRFGWLADVGFVVFCYREMQAVWRPVPRSNEGVAVVQGLAFGHEKRCRPACWPAYTVWGIVRRRGAVDVAFTSSSPQNIELCARAGVRSCGPPCCGPRRGRRRSRAACRPLCRLRGTAGRAVAPRWGR